MRIGFLTRSKQALWLLSGRCVGCGRPMLPAPHTVCGDCEIRYPAMWQRVVGWLVLILVVAGLIWLGVKLV